MEGRWSESRNDSQLLAATGFMYSDMGGRMVDDIIGSGLQECQISIVRF